MEKTRQELLDQLEEELRKQGIGKTGRKLRSDAGKPRGSYNRSEKPRADKGQPRFKYSKTPLYYKNAFVAFIAAHSNAADNNDELARDANLIFPPHITNYYKLCTPPGRLPYRASVRRASHPESLRWRWWFSELYAAIDKTAWTKRICDWYFIDPQDLDAWTYDEWSWAYYTQIGGHDNRHTDRITLSYQAYLDGIYGRPVLDNEANIIWEAK